MKLYLEYVFGGELNTPVTIWQFVYFVTTIMITCICIMLAILCFEVIKWSNLWIVIVIWIIPTIFHIKGFSKYKETKGGK